MIRRGTAAAVTATLALLAFAIGAMMLGGRTSWQAEARGSLEVALTREPEWVTAYKEDLLTRETILPTYGAIVEDERFVEEAADRLGLTPESLPSISVGIEALASQSLITVRASASSPATATRMATQVLRNASRYIASLDRPYELNPVEGFDAGAVQQSGLTRVNIAVLGAACALGGFALYRLLLWLGAARGWLSRVARRPLT